MLLVVDVRINYLLGMEFDMLIDNLLIYQFAFCMLNLLYKHN